MHWICVRRAGFDESVSTRSVSEEIPPVDLDQRKDSEVESSNESTVPGAPLQRPEEFGVRLLVDLHDISSGVNELEVDDEVRGPSMY